MQNDRQFKTRHCGSFFSRNKVVSERNSVNCLLKENLLAQTFKISNDAPSVPLIMHNILRR